MHLNRFRYNAEVREKLSTDVKFPLTGFDIAEFMDPEHRKSRPLYDLAGISHHSGNMHGGHYVAHVNTNCGQPPASASTQSSARWMCFNDARVSSVNASSIGGPSAYVLFYAARECD